jgi:hypothetical protein
MRAKPIVPIGIEPVRDAREERRPSIPRGRCGPQGWRDGTRGPPVTRRVVV